MADPWAAFPAVGAEPAAASAADPWSAFPVAGETAKADERPMPPPGPGVNTTIRPPQKADQPPISQGSFPKAENLMRQAVQGATFGFADEIGAGLGALKALLTDEEYGDLYNKILERNRSQDKQFSEENPVAATAAQIAGGLATAPFTPALQAARGAGLGARMAAGMTTAGGYGALYGAGTGEGIEDRAEKAAGGAAFGAAAGAAVPAIGAGLRAIGRSVAAPFRGAVGADREAARRVGQAFETDGIDIPSAQRTLGMAQQGDVPLVAADVGGNTVRRLARGAATAVPDVEQQMKRLTDERWLGQGDRVRRLTRAITGATEDNEGLVLRLQDAARKANKPAYDRAYRDGAVGLWDAELQQLATAPAVQQAMKAATRTGQNRSAAEGFPPISNPFVFNRDGSVALRPGATPTLQFWDHVQRNLSDAVSVAQRRGANSEARDAVTLHKQLLDHLDRAVPSFGQARAGAAAFFGARDAAEAGVMFVRDTKLETEAVRRGFAKFSNAEKALAKEAFASEVLRQIGATSDRVNVANRIFASPRARERINIVLGEEQGRRLEAMVRVENTMNLLKDALGGSNTGQKLVDLGLVTTAGGGWYYDQSNLTAGALLALALRSGSRQIDARVLRRVGDMLASDDPKVLEKAAGMVARNRQLMDAVRRAENRLARALAPTHPDVSRVIGGAADESNEPRGNGGR